MVWWVSFALQKDSPGPNLWICDSYPHMDKTVIQLRLLRGGANPGLCRGALRAVPCIFTREAEGSLKRRRPSEWCGYKPRNSGSHWKRQRRDPLLGPSERVQPCWHIHSGFLASRAEREYTSVVLRHSVCKIVICEEIILCKKAAPGNPHRWISKINTSLLAKVLCLSLDSLENRS